MLCVILLLTFALSLTAIENFSKLLHIGSHICNPGYNRIRQQVMPQTLSFDWDIKCDLPCKSHSIINKPVKDHDDLVAISLLA